MTTLTVEDFGRRMITSGDLDPIYIALNKCRFLNVAHRNRWLVAYWCFYHAGFASWLSEHEGSDFWSKMMVAAENTTVAPDGGRWPRGTERRHFRGQQGIRAVAELTEEYGARPQDMVTLIASRSLANGNRRPVEAVFAHVKHHRGFGDWISFKVADMLDCCTDYPVEFDNAHIFMFSDPVKGAALAAKSWDNYGPQGTAVTDYVVERLIKEFSDLTAPPLHRRAINVQEVETVLCKWKSHLNGHYPVGKDTKEIRHGLSTWAPLSDTGKSFLAGMPVFAEA